MPCDGRRGTSYEPNVPNRDQYWRMLALGQHRNKLLHWFHEEALWACSFYAAVHSGGVEHHVMQMPSGADHAGACSKQDDEPATGGGGAEGGGCTASFVAPDGREGVAVPLVRGRVPFLHRLFAREFVPHHADASLEGSLKASVLRGTFEYRLSGTQVALFVPPEGEL